MRRRLFRILLDKAIKHTPPGGEVPVSLDNAGSVFSGRLPLPS
jgi:hypothetical protein